MGRITSTPVQVPGAAPDTTPDTEDTEQGAQAESAAPEGETVFTSAKTKRVTVDEKDARIAALEAQLAEAKRLPQVVFEPKTPHGQAALAASSTASMTVAEVIEAIDAGRLKEPLASYLCKDGYYARRS